MTSDHSVRPRGHRALTSGKDDREHRAGEEKPQRRDIEGAEPAVADLDHQPG